MWAHLPADGTFEEMLTNAVVERGRLLAVHMIAKRFKEAGIRLSASERAAFAEALTGTQPMPTIQRRCPRSAVPSVVRLTPDNNREFSHQLRQLVKSSVSMIPRLADGAAEHSLNQFTRHWATHQRVAVRARSGISLSSSVTMSGMLPKHASRVGTVCARKAVCWIKTS
jgi:hypothetical protein